MLPSSIFIIQKETGRSLVRHGHHLRLMSLLLQLHQLQVHVQVSLLCFSYAHFIKNNNCLLTYLRPMRGSMSIEATWPAALPDATDHSY